MTNSQFARIDLLPFQIRDRHGRDVIGEFSFEASGQEAPTPAFVYSDIRSSRRTSG